ncbi:MAG TPA: hypothetical protein VFQ60_04465 [Patescibacteria group bacterium]|nr:hypothetical protein [Patescibacteria group bacterium]
MIRTNEPRPLYREVLWEALRNAWHERRLWVLALFAGILQTGGIYDVFLSSYGETISDVHLASSSWLKMFGSSIGTKQLFSNFFATGVWPRILFALAIAIVLIICSLIAQGALTAGIAARARGERVPFKSLLTRGSARLGAIALLNIITLGLVWFFHAVLYIPVLFAVRGPAVWNVLATVLAFIVFGAVVISLTAIHLFGLQELLVKQGTFLQSLYRAWRLFEKSWLIIVEKGILLLLVGAGILGLAFIVGFIACLPLFAVLFAGLAIGQALVSFIASLMAWMVFLLSLVLAGTLAITFQYAAWNGIYRRISEGTAQAKWHRFTHWLYGARRQKI